MTKASSFFFSLRTIRFSASIIGASNSGGTTTTQGIALSSYSGIQRFYKGIVRNVEQTDEDDLPEASSHIADVEAKDREKFLKRLNNPKRLLLHLSEGTDDSARSTCTARRRGIWTSRP